MIENQLHRNPSDVTRTILNHITCGQFCILDRKDVKLKTTVLGQDNMRGIFIFKSVICNSPPLCWQNTSVGENKEREINTKPSTVGCDGAPL